MNASMFPKPQSLALEGETAPRTRRPRALTLGLTGLAVGAAALVAGGGLLWAQHGPTVFFDLMSAGIASCL